MTDAVDTNTIDANVVRDDLLARFAAVNGGEASELQKVLVTRALQLAGLASRLRDRASRGDPVDVTEWLRVETLASEAIAALNVPALPSKPVQALTVEFIHSPQHPENERLHERIRELEADLRAARIQAALDGKGTCCR